MRRILAAGVIGLCLTASILGTGCDSKGPAQTPKAMDVPKEGPQPVGGGGAPKGKRVPVDPGSTNQ